MIPAGKIKYDETLKAIKQLHNGSTVERELFLIQNGQATAWSALFRCPPIIFLTNSIINTHIYSHYITLIIPR